MCQTLMRSIRIGRLVLLAQVLLMISVSAILLSTYRGDSNIYLIYANSLARGDGFTFNPGQFSSGATGPLWALVLTPLAWVGATPWMYKVYSFMWGLLSLYLVVLACRRVGQPPFVAALIASVVISFSIVSMCFIYESGLVICLVSSSVIHHQIVMERISNRERSSAATWLGLCLVWAALPLARPDAAILVCVQFAVLVSRRPLSHSVRVRICVAWLVSWLPALCYFLVSMELTGYASVSAAARSFALHEAADQLYGVRYSLAVFALARWPEFVSLLLGVVWAAFFGSPRAEGRQLPRMALWGAAMFIVSMVFVVPAVRDAARYFIPVMPLLGVAASPAVSALYRSGGYRPVMAVICGVLLYVVPGGRALRTALAESRAGASFALVMEYPVADILNEKAVPGSSVLAYEVQVRYRLRPDLNVLSLDGITDGLVIPYLRTCDLAGFLRHHRPRYWIANAAIGYRRCLSRSILARVIEEVELRGATRVGVDGLVFSVLAVNEDPLPTGLAGFEYLFEIDYEPKVDAIGEFARRSEAGFRAAVGNARNMGVDRDVVAVDHSR